MTARATQRITGVETQGQLDFLRSEGCDEVQGYHLARPLPAQQVADLILRLPDQPYFGAAAITSRLGAPAGRQSTLKAQQPSTPYLTRSAAP